MSEQEKGMKEYQDYNHADGCPCPECKQDNLLLTELKEIVLQIRQYLCNTEFAPEPFTKPIDPEKLTVDFPKQILAKAKQHYELEKAFAKEEGFDAGVGHERKYGQKRLDRPELRENFLLDLRLLEEHKTSPEWIAMKYLYELALIPDEKEAVKRIKKQARDTIKGIEEMYEKDEANTIEEAKKQEGERIIGIIKEYKLESASVRDDMLELRAKGWKLLWQA